MDLKSWDKLVRKARKACLERQPPPQKDVYEATLDQNWERMKRHLVVRKFFVLSPVTISRDTALHLAVYSREKEPLETLLDISQVPGIPKPRGKDALSIKNACGNTILHEAVIAGNLEAVKLLVPEQPTDRQLKQIDVQNDAGETPLFTAASYGRRKILAHFLVELPGQHFTNKQLKEIHRQRNDKKSILHAAIEGQHFESALLLLCKDNSLCDLEDSEGMTCLHHLAAMPSAFKSGYNMGAFGRFIYSCSSFSYAVDKEVPSSTDKDGEGGRSCIDKVLKPIRTICEKIFKGWPMVEEIWKQKRKHESARELVRLMVQLNQSRSDQFIHQPPTESSPPNGQRREGGGARQEGRRQGVEDNVNGQPNTGESKEENKISPPSNPLFISISNGILEIAKATLDIYHPQAANDLRRNVLQATIQLTNNVDVQQPTQESKENRSSLPPHPLFIAISNGVKETAEAILNINPQAIELVNDKGQNILHVAVLHRQRDIFRLIKSKSILLERMGSKIDNKGYSLLHQVADTTHYCGGNKPSPALKLQEELKWFKRVEKIAPYHLLMHRDENNKTAWELFVNQHEKQLKKASEWIEKTSQSCSAVAVLVATVVFAAAYTVPGGSDDHGLPILLHSRFFLAFTVLDVIALASSLTSVVMFLSILTTPFECEKFYHDIPRKLLWGFTLLFFSVMTTMLAFGCTLFLIIRFRNQHWIAGLMSVAAFIPVSVFVVMQFSLYIECFRSLKEFYVQIIKFLPCYSSKTKCLPRFSSCLRYRPNKKGLTFDG